MRLMANENLAVDMVAGLRAAGHDVISVGESYPGMRDEDVLRTAHAQGRIVTTHDKRFGKLAFEAGASSTCGVILLRLRLADLDDAVRRVVAALRTECTWAEHVATIEVDRIRLHRLPQH